MRSVVWVVIGASLAFSGCGGCSDDAPPMQPEFPHAALAVRCNSTFPANEVFTVGPTSNDIVLAVRANDGLLFRTSRGVISRDGGQTVAAVPLRSYPAAGATELQSNILGGRTDINAVDVDLFSSMRPYSGGGDDMLGNPLDRTVVVDGVGLDVHGESGGIAVPGGVADRVWRADATHWFATRGFHVYGSRDAGATWKDAGLIGWLAQQAGERLMPIDARGEALILDDVTDSSSGGPFWVIDETGKNEVDLSILARHTPATHARVRFWGNRLVLFNYGHFYVTDDRGGTWTELQSLEVGDFADEFDGAEDASGNLYVYPIAHDPGAAIPRVYRYAPGDVTPTVIDLDIAPLTMGTLAGLHLLSDGRLRFVASVGNSREAYAGILCEAGPGVTAELTTAAVESLDVAASTDRVVRIARFKELDDITDRMAVSPAGRAYVTGYQTVLARPSDAPLLYSGTIGNVPQDGYGIVPSALGPVVTDWTVASYMYGDPKPTAGTLFDIRTAAMQRTPFAFTGPVYATAISDRGALLYGRAGMNVFGDLATTYPNELVTDGPHAAVLSNLARDRLAPALGPTWTIRFDPWRERIPDLVACLAASPPAECIPSPEMAATAAQFDLDGNLYVLDALRSRVVMLPAGSTSWQEIARGFLSPTDLLVRRVGNQWVVIVDDGDVFAFRASGGVKVRGGSVTRRDVPVVALRDLHDCTVDGPCLDDSGTAIAVATPSACVAGTHLGSGGKAFAGATELTVSSWSDNQVCVTAPTSVLDGLLQVVRDDGVASNTLPLIAAGAVTTWTVPTTVTFDTVVRATGTNLGAGRIDNIVQEGDLFARWALAPGAQELIVAKSFGELARQSVVVSSKIVRGCRTGRDQWCTLYGSFGSADTVTAGGIGAVVEQVSGSALTFAWPAALAPGVHTISVQGAGTAATIQAELLADSAAPLVLQRDAPLTSAMSYRNPRPVVTARGLLANLDDWTLNTVNGELVPAGQVAVVVEADTPELALQTAGTPLHARDNGFNTMLQPARPVHPFDFGPDVYAVGSKAGDATKAAIYRLDSSPTKIIETNGGGSDAVQVAAVTTLSGNVLVALSSETANTTRVVPIAISGNTGIAGTAVTLTGSYGFAGAELVSHGAFFAGNGIYLTSCHVPTAGARIEYAGLSFSGPTLTATAQTTVLDSSTARLVACNTTSQGLVYVQQDSALHRVYTHVPGSAPTLVATIPSTLPGWNDVFNYSNDSELPGITDVALLADGDVLLLLDEHDTNRGLYLARYDIATSTWSTTKVVEPGATWQRGEICIGPHLSTFACPTLGRDGCAPNACAIRPPEIRPLATSQIGEAYIVVRGSEVSIVYEAIDPLRRAIGNVGGSDVLHVKVPLP